MPLLNILPVCLGQEGESKEKEVWIANKLMNLNKALLLASNFPVTASTIRNGCSAQQAFLVSGVHCSTAIRRQLSCMHIWNAEYIYSPLTHFCGHIQWQGYHTICNQFAILLKPLDTLNLFQDGLHKMPDQITTNWWKNHKTMWCGSILNSKWFCCIASSVLMEDLSS